MGAGSMYEALTNILLAYLLSVAIEYWEVYSPL